MPEAGVNRLQLCHEFTGACELMFCFQQEPSPLSSNPNKNPKTTVNLPSDLPHRFCQSELHREVATNLAVRILIKSIARPTEVGARTLIYGAGVGSETHGQYVPDCKITPTKGLTEGEAGMELQAEVWQELKAKLEAVRPGVTSLA